MDNCNVIKSHRYSGYFLIGLIALFAVFFLLPSYSHAFCLGGYDSYKGLDLSSANSFLTLGMDHDSGLILGFESERGGLDPNRYPGLIPIVQISPLLILVGFVFFGIHRLYMAFKPVTAGYGMEPENALNAAIGLVFIAIGFIAFNILVNATDTILAIFS